MVTTFYPPANFGGDGRYIRRLVHALARRGCEVEVIHDADAWSVLSGGAKLGEPEPEPPGVVVHRLQSSFPQGSVLLTQQLGRPVVNGGKIKRLLERDFDVIHYHNISLVGGPGVLEIGDALKLYTAHEHWLVCPMHVLWRHNRELCTGRECFKCAIAHRRPHQLWRVGRQPLLDATPGLPDRCCARHARRDDISRAAALYSGPRGAEAALAHLGHAAAGGR